MFIKKISLHLVNNEKDVYKKDFVKKILKIIMKSADPSQAGMFIVP